MTVNTAEHHTLTSWSLVHALMLCIVWSLLSMTSAQAITPAQKLQLAVGEYEQKSEVLDALVKAGDIDALPFLADLLNDAVKFKDEQVWLVHDEQIINALTGEVITELPEEVEDVVINSLLQNELESSVATLQLLSSDIAVRQTAAEQLRSGEPNRTRLLAIQQARTRETHTDIQAILDKVIAAMALASGSKPERLAAIELLSQHVDSGTKQLLSSRLATDGETDADVIAAIQAALKQIEHKQALYDYVGQAFTGISLGSILLLAALGLAITYGLMGIINMAHGEMMMLGAYATFLVQNLFTRYLPDLFQWYLLAALPVAFFATALIGIVLERLVLKHLYGRPLETLLATWGVSLMLMQSVRSLFGAQNVQVENPVWMSGGWALSSNLVLPYNRIIIIAFAVAVLLLIWLMITKTRLGLYIRAVTQNRQMASCTGVNTSKVDAMAFGLGSGIAGLAGVALSQIGNVGPALGQSYIVDSFMVVVLGGVGQLAGTVYAAMGLGVLGKLFEGWAGAVLAKIMILVIVIVFIQKRPQGLFAFKGRQID